jgi:hypothetical protein
LCINCWDSVFRTQFQHFILRFPYFADITKRGLRGWKTGWRQCEDRVTLWISLLCHVLLGKVSSWTAHYWARTSHLSLHNIFLFLNQNWAIFVSVDVQFGGLLMFFQWQK